MATTPQGEQKYSAMLSLGTRLMVKHHKSGAIQCQLMDAECYRIARNDYNRQFYPDRPREL